MLISELGSAVQEQEHQHRAVMDGQQGQSGGGGGSDGRPTVNSTN